jgi:hypothetical protein
MIGRGSSQLRFSQHDHMKIIRSVFTQLRESGANIGLFLQILIDNYLTVGFFPPSCEVAEQEHFFLML